MTISAEERMDGITEAIKRFTDFDVKRPCQFLPGSNEKIAFVHHRWQLGLDLWNDYDKRDDPPIRQTH